MKTKEKLSLLWIFVTLNYLYCDVLGLMDANVLNELITGSVGAVQMTEGFLLGASILMEIPIAMIVVSRLLRHDLNRWLNLAAATIMTLVQVLSLLVGDTTHYYLFFSVIEVATTLYIIKTAWQWRTDSHSKQSFSPTVPEY